jgi:hypothetical protein
MQYLGADGQIWKFSDREFKRQMKNVVNGGSVDLSRGKELLIGYGNNHRLEDANDADEAQYMLDHIIS